MDKITPIFIFALPRSGSTLLQRLLINHSKISSISEPWILLPLLNLYNLDKKGNSIYNDSFSSKAVYELINRLSNKENSYFEYLNNLVTSIYSNLSVPDSIYFIDKTPRYYHIIKDIHLIFPNAKFIFLTRHPLGVINSVMKTWFYGTFPKTQDHSFDIDHGFQALFRGYELLKDRSILVRYEDLINNSGVELNKIFDYLNLPHLKKDDINLFSNKLEGGFGDKTGKKKYTNIDSKSIEGWKIYFNSYLGNFIANKIYKRFSVEERFFFNFNKPNFKSPWYKFGLFIYLDYYFSKVLSKTSLWYNFVSLKQYVKSFLK